MKFKSVLDSFDDLFHSKTSFALAKKSLKKIGYVKLDYLLYDAQYRSLELRCGKAGFLRGIEIRADWCYYTTPPVVMRNNDGVHFLIAQWNGPCLNHYTICKGKKLVQEFLLGMKDSVIILKKPKYEERVRKALRLLK